MLMDDFTTCEAKTDTNERPEVRELIERRDKFLSDHPDLRAVQDEIDFLMSTTLDPKVRLEILFMLISEKLDEMRAVFEEVGHLAAFVIRERKAHILS